MSVPALLFFIQFDLPIPYALRVWFEFRQHSNLLSRKKNVSYSSEGIAIKSEMSEEFVKWQAFELAIENHEYFLLVYAQKLYKIIPKRAFQNEEEIRLFRSTLAEQLGNIRTY